ncbi:MAG: response regulator transcription factor [Anaerolineales bacterium]|nr:response regulator transcription factor [Anaerolineales bacterium]
MEPVKVLLADDHRMLREGLRTMLEQSDRIRVIGEAQDGVQAVAMAEHLKPDVVVMDIAMPNMNGIEATRAIRTHRPETKVVILTMYDTEEYVSEILKAGATCYVTKEAAGEELLQAIQSAAKGAVYLQSTAAGAVIGQVLKQSPEGGSETELTHREMEILRLIGQGLTNRAMAAHLNLSLHTVRSHRSNIMRKMAAHNAAELVSLAVQKGLILP